MSIFGQFYPLKDMTQNMENDQLDELYNSTKAVFWFSEVVQKSVSSLHKSAIISDKILWTVELNARSMLAVYLSN